MKKTRFSAWLAFEESSDDVRRAIGPGYTDWTNQLLSAINNAKQEN